MATFTQRMPDDLHKTARAWLARVPWASQTDLVNEAVARYVGMPESRRFLRLQPRLDDCVTLGLIDEPTARRARAALLSGSRLLVRGPLSSGRTRLARALLDEYQRVEGFPRRALVLASFPKEYDDADPLLLLPVERHGAADCVGAAIAGITTEYDIVFVDASTEVLGEPRVVEFLKTARKRRIGMVAVTLASDRVPSAAEAQFDVMLEVAAVARPR